MLCRTAIFAIMYKFLCDFVLVLNAMMIGFNWCMATLIGVEFFIPFDSSYCVVESSGGEWVCMNFYRIPKRKVAFVHYYNCWRVRKECSVSFPCQWRQSWHVVFDLAFLIHVDLCICQWYYHCGLFVVLLPKLWAGCCRVQTICYHDRSHGPACL